MGREPALVPEVAAMSTNKFKRVVRARMARTGEKYAQALAALQDRAEYMREKELQAQIRAVAKDLRRGGGQ